MKALLELTNISKYKLNEAEFQRLLGISAEWISGLQSGFAHPNSRNSENECFELIINFCVKTDALSFKNIHNFVRFTNFVKIKIKI